MSRVAKPGRAWQLGKQSNILAWNRLCVYLRDAFIHTLTHTHMNLYVYLCINKTQNVLISRRSRLFHMFPTYFTLFMQFVVLPEKEASLGQ